MKINVNIECDSVDELAQVVRLHGGRPPSALNVPQLTVPVPEPDAPDASTAEAAPAAPEAPPKPPAKRRGRKPKGNGAKDPAPAEEPAAGSVAEAAEAIAEKTEPVPTNVSVDEVRDAIAVYSSNHDIAKARELLKRFGAGKVSDVKEADYVEFVAACGK